MAFWDASAIAPLCCSQPATNRGRKLLRETRRMVVWWGTPVEARSAFARLARDGQLSDAEQAKAIRLLAQLRESWDEIQPSEKVRPIAGELPDRYGVRAADAMQLA